MKKITLRWVPTTVNVPVIGKKTMKVISSTDPRILEGGIFQLGDIISLSDDYEITILPMFLQKHKSPLLWYLPLYILRATIILSFLSVISIITLLALLVSGTVITGILWASCTIWILNIAGVVYNLNRRFKKKSFNS